ncbi:MAG: DUF2232 domain-containing protein [Desulfosporosinus sp.]|jgi:hypothetical protein
MFFRDEVVMNYLSVAILLIFPWWGIVLGTWGFIWGMLMLLAVFWVGLRRGLPLAALFLLFGYMIPLIVFGVTAFKLMSLVPLAGLLGILGWSKHWPVRVVFFWSAALAAVLGTIPFLLYLAQGFSALPTNDIINTTIQQYQASGLMEMMQQQGISEVQVRDLLQRIIEIYTLSLPGFAALAALIEYGIAYYIMRIWVYKEKGKIPFARWRLPWYAIWGAVLGISFYLIGDQFSWTFLRVLGINIMVVYAGIALVLGISAAVYLFKKIKIPRFLKIALIIVGFFYFYYSVIGLIIFGLFDLVLNFRRLPEEM